MSLHTWQELEEAKTSLASTLRKFEKMQESGRLQPSQKDAERQAGQRAADRAVADREGDAGP